jgi:hypothetical protein
MRPQGDPDQLQAGSGASAGTGGVNTMAVLSLVFAIVFAPLGIVFGHLAKHQIARTGQRGGGIATAGLLIGYIVVAIAVISAGIALVGGGGGSGGGGGGY